MFLKEKKRATTRPSLLTCANTVNVSVHEYAYASVSAGTKRDSRNQHPGMVPASAAPSRTRSATREWNPRTAARAAVTTPHRMTMDVIQARRPSRVNRKAEGAMQRPYDTKKADAASPYWGRVRDTSCRRTGAARPRLERSTKVRTVMRAVTGRKGRARRERWWCFSSCPSLAHCARNFRVPSPPISVPGELTWHSHPKHASQ